MGEKEGTNSAQTQVSPLYNNLLVYAPRVKAHPRGSGQPRGHSRPQVVSPGSSRPNEESIQPSAHSCKAGGGTLIPAPKAHADARRPCVQPRTQFGNPPIGSQGPFWAGGQAPPIHRGDELRSRASLMPSRGRLEAIRFDTIDKLLQC